MVYWKKTRNINLALAEEVLVELDEAAKQHHMSRSAYIRLVLDEAITKIEPRNRYKKRGDEDWLYDLDDS